jgi:nucleoside-triphosphatase
LKVTKPEAEQVKNFLVTGVPGIGKTTLIRNLCKHLASLNPEGFYTEEIREGGIRKGFALVSLDGKRSVLSHVNVKSRFRVGKYGVDVRSFEAFLESLRLRARAGSLIVMDEIGKMECFSANFVSLVRELLDGAGVVVATVATKGPDFISEVKRRRDILIYEVTESNRNDLAERLSIEIQAALRSVQTQDSSPQGTRS